ncbi:MAG TPA: hypothetical protein VLN58_10145 [Verrucomicrobiae bacterium]|nr:hypothetical protein [Verrucomicrobiae bacterium]
MNRRFVQALVVCLALAGTAFSQINSSTYHYVAINFPGGASTEAHGINNFGEIVGFFNIGVANCQFGSTLCRFHGFKLKNKVFTRIDIPGATDTRVLGLNDGGDIVGDYRTSDSSIHGFLLHHTGTLQKINQPGSNFTSASGVNNSLTVVGTGITGFIWKNGVFTKLDITNHATGGESETINGISNLGVIVGSLFRQDFQNAWQKAGSDLDIYQRINGLDTLLNGVNGRDDVVGTATVLNRGFVSFHVESSETGETSETLKPVRIHFPNATDTIPWSINYAQAIVGSFTGSDNVSHGFLAVH